MASIKSIKDKFCRNAVGITAAVATVASLAGPAGAHEMNDASEINYAMGMINSSADQYSSMSDRDASIANAVYTDVHRLFLTYEGQGDTASSQADLNRDIVHLMNRYDLGDNQTFDRLMEKIHAHQHVASGIYTAVENETGTGMHLFEADNPALAPVKAVAVLEIQQRLSRFLEDAYPHFAQSSDRTQRDIQAFSNLCQYANAVAPYALELQNSLAESNPNLRSWYDHEARPDTAQPNGQLTKPMQCP